MSVANAFVSSRLESGVSLKAIIIDYSLSQIVLLELLHIHVNTLG